VLLDGRLEVEVAAVALDEPAGQHARLAEVDRPPVADGEVQGHRGDQLADHHHPVHVVEEPRERPAVDQPGRAEEAVVEGVLGADPAALRGDRGEPEAGRVGVPAAVAAGLVARQHLTVRHPPACHASRKRWASGCCPSVAQPPPLGRESEVEVSVVEEPVRHPSSDR
jgi:hypothetical protein